MSDEHALVRFNIPAAFVVARAMPTGAELAYGFREGWLTSVDVVAVALAKYEADLPLRSGEEELALLLSEDLDRVDELITDLEIVDEPSEQRARLWLFLALAWLLEHRQDFRDPLEVIEMLYADFDYPDEIQGLVRFMPTAPGEAAAVDALEQRWRAFVDRVTVEYQQRDLAPNA